MLKRLGFALAPLAALAALLWLLPMMLSWEGAAERLKTRLKDATGYELTIQDEVKGTLLPSPAVLLTEGEIRPPQGKEGVVIAAPLIKAALGWSVLWGGEELGDIQVIQPRIWQEGQKADMLAMVTRLPLPIRVEKGSWGKEAAADAPVFSLSWQPGAQESTVLLQMGEGESQWQVQGTLAAAQGEQPADANLTWSDAQTKATVQGKMVLTQGDSRFSGQLSLHTEDWSRSLSHAWPFWKKLALDDLGPKALEMQGALSWGQGRLKLEKLQIGSGSDTMVLTMDMAREGPVFDVALEVNQADMDPYIASAQRIVQALKKALVAEREQTAEYKLGVADTGLWSAAAAGKVAFKATSLQWRGMPVSNAEMQLELTDKIWTLHQAKALLPGEAQTSLAGVVREYQNNWMFIGKAEAQGKDLRQSLAFLAVPLPEIPQGRLGAFTSSGTVTVTPLVRRITEWVLEADGAKASGAVIVRLPDPNAVPEVKAPTGLDPSLIAGIKAKKEAAAAPVAAAPAVGLPEVEASIALVDADMDSYMPPEPFLLGEDAAPTAMADRLRWLAELPFRLKLATVAQPVTFRGMVWDRVQAKLEAAPGRWEVQAFKAYKQGGAIFSGNLVLAQGETRPRLNLTLAGGPLRDSEVMDFIAGKPQPAKEKKVLPGEYKWSETPIDLSLLNLFDGQITLQLDQLHMMESDFKDVTLKGSLLEQALTFDQLGASLSQGAIQMRGIVRSGTLPQMDVGFALQEVDVEKLLGLVLETKGLSGKATISGVLKATGVSARSLVEKMVATGTIQVRDLVMEGFDLNAISRKVLAARTVDDVGSLARVALEGGVTRINQMEAKFAIKDNLMQFPVTSLATDFTQGGIQATVDVLRFLMNARFSFTPKTATDNTVPPVHLLVQGQAETPTKKLDTADLEAYIAKRAVRSGL